MSRKGKTTPSLFWVTNPFSPCDLGPQLKSSPVNNRIRGGVGLSSIPQGREHTAYSGRVNAIS